MAKHHLLLSYLFLGALVKWGSVASVSPETYWKLRLPYTPMPDSIRQSLIVGPPGPPASVGVDEPTDRFWLSYSNKESLASSNKQGLVSTNGYDGLLSYETKHDHAKESSLVDSSAARERFFFVEKDLRLGTRMSLHFQKSTRKATFLPRRVSHQIPFSSDKVEETLQLLSLDPKSKEAHVLSERIELCEEPTIEGVEKQCVTSLESMVDYVISKIGSNVRAIATQVEKDSEMLYAIEGVKKLAKNDQETVVCHKMGYPYALFYCHRTKTIRSYMVSLLGKDGTKLEAVAACHMESNHFLDSYAKNVLKIVPGSTHICHFPPAEDTVIWVAM